MARNKILMVFSAVLPVIIIFFMLKNAISSYNAVVWQQIKFSYIYLAASLFFMIVGYMLLAYAWREILLSMHENISMSKGIFYWCLSQLGKFIPGNIWFAVGRAYLTRKENIHIKSSVVSMIIESAIMAVTAICIGLLFLAGSLSSINNYIAYIFIAPLLLVMIHPKIIAIFLKFAGKIIKKDLNIKLEYNEIFYVFFYYILAWMMIGTGFALFVEGIAENSLSILYLAGTFFISWAAGFLVFFVPSGIGVREGVMASILSTEFGIAFATIIAFAARLWWIIGEIVAWPLAYLAYLFAKKLKQGKVENIPGNYFNKYTSRNPLVKIVMKMFFARLFRFIVKAEAKKILDIGCGEGYVTGMIKKKFKVEIVGCDIEEEVIRKARKLNPKIAFKVCSIEDIKEKDNSFDLVIANEVLEHLYEHDKALSEIKRVTKKYVIITVPREPIWRMANIVRLKYLKQLGNTPGHVQNFSRKEIRNLLSKNFRGVEVKSAGLWSIALCEK